MEKTILILILTFLLTLAIASGDITCSETIDRNVPSTANGDFQITYTASGTSGMWGASITDSVSGGCKFPAGTATYKTVMLSEDGNTKTITITAPSSGTCTFSGGDYMFGTCAIGNIADDSITISASTCVYSSWVKGSCGAGDCSDNERQYTRTVTSGTGCTATTKCESDSTCVTCVDTTWTPSPSTKCSGEIFIQESNCGNTKSETGTKSCTNCGDGTCNSGEDCESCPSDCGECEEPPEEKCEFWEKMEEGECEVNVGLIIVLFVLALFFRGMFK